MGGGSVAGDLRWTGSYGVQADIVARTHCSVELIKTEDIMVCTPLRFRHSCAFGKEITCLSNLLQINMFFLVAGHIGKI